MSRTPDEKKQKGRPPLVDEKPAGEVLRDY